MNSDIIVLYMLGFLAGWLSLIAISLLLSRWDNEN